MHCVRAPLDPAHVRCANSKQQASGKSQVVWKHLHKRQVLRRSFVRLWFHGIARWNTGKVFCCVSEVTHRRKGARYCRVWRAGIWHGRKKWMRAPTERRLRPSKHWRRSPSWQSTVHVGLAWVVYWAWRQICGEQWWRGLGLRGWASVVFPHPSTDPIIIRKRALGHERMHLTQFARLWWL